MSPAVTNLVYVFALWFCLAILCCGGSRFADVDKQSNSPSIHVSASVLISEYEANEVAADQTYKGRTLSVTGKVDHIGKDILDTMYVTLESGQEFGISSVQCMFDDQHEGQLARLSKGQTVTVTGRCDGKLGNVLLRGCSLR